MLGFRMVPTWLSALFLTLFGPFIDCGSVQAKVLQASLRADSRETPAGGSVTLTCSVDASADWRYYWFKKQTSEYSKSFMIQSGTAEQNITVSEEGIYYCRGGRGDPVVFTEDSNTVTIDIINTPSKAARITQNPSWIKIFTGERMSLTCVISDGDGTQWEYEWKTTSSEKPVKSTEDWVFYTSVSSDGDYWCRGKQKMDLRPTTWSYPIRLTVLSSKPKATLNVALFRWDGVWTLTCSVNTSPSTWKYFWYLGEIPSEIMPGEDATVSNKQILVSQRGLYWCRGGRGEPVYYTEFSEPLKVGTNQESESAAGPTPPTSVTRPPCEKEGSGSPETSPLMTGMVCGNLLLCGSLVLLLIILLRKIKELSSRLESNRASGEKQRTDPDPDSPYSHLTHGDIAIYESIPPSRNLDTGPEERGEAQTSAVL
ncbi:uncharacterized protein LOC116732495 [Xiphophorus hellerii]|uniref:uncharacterized protein LOC116732495 n=1 Tax=Xiphophorus hellerii TaxID=8084 RepID=UPI0013B40395|nr:uncharacterized protein LOC116732495 [Xiphophorus hellerii]